MRERLKKGLPILGVICGACLVLAAVVLGEQIAKGMSGILFGTGGGLVGVGGARGCAGVRAQRVPPRQKAPPHCVHRLFCGGGYPISDVKKATRCQVATCHF